MNMLRNGCLLLIIAIVALAGCEKEALTETSSTTSLESIESDSAEIQHLKKQLLQMADELQKAQRTINELHKASIATPFDRELSVIRDQFPQISRFTSPQTYADIEVRSGSHVHQITDPTLLRSLGDLIIVKRQYEFGSPPLPDLEPVEYRLTTDKGSVRVTFVRQDIVSFDDLYPGQYFEVNKDASLLGRAFGTMPAYLSAVPTIVKMVNSGVLRIKDSGTINYLRHAGRIRALALAYFYAEKSAQAQPASLPKDPAWQATFYYYGEQVQLQIDDNSQIYLKDGDNEQRFKAEPADIGQLKSILSAG